MTLTELVEKALTEPVSLIADNLFYVISFRSNEIHMQGDYTANLVKLLPSHVRDKLRLNDNDHLTCTVKSTVAIDPSNVDGNCWSVDITLTPDD